MHLTPDEQQSLSRLLDRPINDNNAAAMIAAVIRELQRAAASKKLSIDLDDVTDTFDLDGAQVAALNAKIREWCRAVVGRGPRASHVDPDLGTRAAAIYPGDRDDDDLNKRAAAAYGAGAE